MSARGPGRPAKVRDKSPSTTPVPSTEQQNDGSQLPDAEWDAMSKVLNAIYDYRTEDGLDPSKLFHRKVNKRVIPEYYETIKEPMAMSTIKQKIHTRAYQSWAEFVRDFALIAHNAQVFNVPDSGAFQDALVIKELLQKELQILVADGMITQDVATLPDLGEIPTYENVPVENAGGEEGEDDESDDDGEDEDEEEGEEDEEGRKKRRRGRPSKNVVREDGETKRARGRPPKLLTPMEARMQAILRALRRPKNVYGQLMIKHFDRLPDKAAMPEYYSEVRTPMAYDQIKRKAKRKKYRTLEEFMADVNLMFNNAKSYNMDGSRIYRDAVDLQVEAGKVYDEESAKPDDSFADEEGKIPMPNGILHNGELYKVGDWVHLQNPNDLTKPMPAQIYRTYKNPAGQNMVNVCWYYRPEQTVHRFDKHFFPNEIVKTGRYRDHNVDEVEGKCFVMFYTRYFKGRPRNLPEGTEVYVCQARYNETLHQFNTIKTWASCLPDEVRDRDYEMDLFDHPRKMKKLPSPIAYLFKEEQNETDELPKVQWGADGAPPKIGAVHRRPRNEKDSPPPEPTPPPPPKPPTPPPAQIRSTPQMSTPATSQQGQRPPMSNARSSYTQQHGQGYSLHMPSPATQRPPSAQQPSHPPSTPQHYQPAPPRPTQPSQTSFTASSHGAPSASQGPYAPRPPTINYRDPPAIEVYTLPDAANLSIPAEIREHYQRDDLGHVLFFTTPPVAVGELASSTTLKGHSVRYLAEKARRQDMLERKRKERQSGDDEQARVTKIARLEAETSEQADLNALKQRALTLVGRQLAASGSDELSKEQLSVLSKAQKVSEARQRRVEENGQRREQRKRVVLDSRFFIDDWEPLITS